MHILGAELESTSNKYKALSKHYEKLTTGLESKDVNIDIFIKKNEDLKFQLREANEAKHAAEAEYFAVKKKYED